MTKMSDRKKRKPVKGGTEKLRVKKLKLREEDAKSCLSIKNMFQASGSKISDTATNLVQDDFVETEICNSSESDNQKKQTSNFTFDKNSVDEENSISLEKDQIFEYFKKPDDSDIESYL